MLDFLAAYFGSDNALTFILWPIFIGIVLGILYSIFQNLLIGSFVKRLFADEITASDRAKTLAELGFTKTFLLRLALRPQTSLRRMVLLLPDGEDVDPDLLLLTAVQDAEEKEPPHADEESDTESADDEVQEASEEDEDEPREIDPALAAVTKNTQLKANFERDRWYLNPREQKRASQYNRDGASPLTIVLSVVALFGLAIAAFYLIPFITDLIASVF